MIYSINMYSRDALEEVYESVGKFYLQCIPRKNERLTYEKKIFQVEDICYRIGDNTEPDISMYCVYIGPVGTKVLCKS